MPQTLNLQGVVVGNSYILKVKGFKEKRAFYKHSLYFVIIIIIIISNIDYPEIIHKML